MKNGGKIFSLLILLLQQSFLFSMNKSQNVKLLNYLKGFSLYFLSPNYSRVETLLEDEGTNPNAVDENGCSSLHFVSQMILPDMVKLLLYHGANSNQRDTNDETPLHKIMKNVQPSAFEYFSENLKQKILENAQECISMLLAKGADPNMRNKTKETPNSLVRKCGLINNHERLEDKFSWFSYLCRDLYRLFYSQQFTDAKIGDIWVHNAILEARLGLDAVSRLTEVINSNGYEKEDILDFFNWVYTGFVFGHSVNIVQNFCRELDIDFEEKKGSIVFKQDMKKLLCDDNWDLQICFKCKSCSDLDINMNMYIPFHKHILYSRTKKGDWLINYNQDEDGIINNDSLGFSPSIITWMFMREFLYTGDIKFWLKREEAEDIARLGEKLEVRMEELIPVLRWKVNRLGYKQK